MGEPTKVVPVSIVIPTFRRPKALAECVHSLLEGTLRPAEIIVVGRKGDSETESLLPGLHSGLTPTINLRSSWVTAPGHLPPVAMGLRLATNGIVAVLDDDVTVANEWLERILVPFSDPSVGVVGGRVLVPGSSRPKLRGRPGCTSWYGKTWGNIGSVEGDHPIEVHGVQECNWAWRRQLAASLQFDTVLNFDAAPMYGLDLCAQARERGFRVVYEPRALVLHHAAPRAPELDRSDRRRREFAYCRNYTYIMLKHLPWWRRVAFLVWWLLIGHRNSPGIAGFVALPLLPKTGARDVALVLRGKLRGIRLWRARQRGVQWSECLDSD